MSIASASEPAPAIVDMEANAAFRDHAISIGEDPDSKWVGHYVEYEWNRCRHVFENAIRGIEDKRALEFGCNLGATAIVLAHLGADVTAVDVDERYVELARLNAKDIGPNLRSSHSFPWYRGQLMPTGRIQSTLRLRSRI